MARITALKAQKRSPNRLNVYLDGEFSFGVERIVAAWLKIGDEVDSDKLQSLLKQDELERAFMRALHFINFRVRSVYEVSQRLIQAGYGPETVEKTIIRLQNSGLLGDKKFAKTWVENRCTFRPRSRRVLELELRHKGVKEIEIQSATKSLDETQLAQKAAEKVANRFGKLPFDEFRKKMFGYLTRRGFNFNIAAETVQSSWKEFQTTAETPIKNET